MFPHNSPIIQPVRDVSTCQRSEPMYKKTTGHLDTLVVLVAAVENCLVSWNNFLEQFSGGYLLVC